MTTTIHPHKGRSIRRNPDEPMRVIGYVRVSTDKQEVGPEVQMYALEAVQLRLPVGPRLRHDPRRRRTRGLARLLP